MITLCAIKVTLFVASVAVASVPAVAAPTAGALMAGAGRADIALTPAMLPIDGFAAVHDPLAARVLVVAEGADRAAIAEVDQTSMSGDLVDAIKATVAQATGVSAAAVLVVASHTFSAPHIFLGPHLPPGTAADAAEQQRTAAYRGAVMAAVADAAAAAARTAAPARIAAGEGISDVNINRNVPMADGWWLGPDPAGYSDKRMPVVRIDRIAGGDPVAILINYAVQSAVMDHSVGTAGKGVTADVGGTAARHVEAQYGGAVAMFLTGAAGDQQPAYTARRNLYDKNGHLRFDDLGDAGYGLLAVEGQRLGEDAVRAVRAAMPLAADRPIAVASNTVTLPAQPRPRNLQQIKPTRHYPFAVEGTSAAPFAVLRIGDLAIVGVQAELSAQTGASIRARSPFARTLIVTMVNGSAKYMPERQAYADITYEAMNSSYAPGSAETFADAIVARLNAARRGR